MEDIKNTVEAVEAVVENNDVMTEAVKKGLNNKTVICIVAATAISAGAAYVIYKKLQKKKAAANEAGAVVTEQTDPNVKMALLKSKPANNESCENENPKFEPDENR